MQQLSVETVMKYAIKNVQKIKIIYSLEMNHTVKNAYCQKKL